MTRKRRGLLRATGVLLLLILMPVRGHAEGSLVWLPDGSGLVVAGQWLFTPGTTTWERLAFSAGDRTLLPSPDGERFLLFDRTEYEVWDRHARQTRGTIPPFEPLDAEPDYPAPALDTRTAAFWLDNRRIYLAQTTPWAPPACRLLEVTEGRWSEVPGGCLPAEGQYFLHFAACWNGRVAAIAEAEGHPSLRYFQISATAGPREIPGPAISLYPSGPMRIACGPGGGLDLATPCELDAPGKHPCADLDDPPWAVWTWDETGTLTLRLKAGSFPLTWSPAARTAAWMEEGKGLCLQKSGTSTPTCIGLPQAIRSPGDPP